MRRSKHNWLGWFLFGLGSQLQLLGVSLSFSELFVFAVTPFLALQEYPHIRRDGLAAFFWLAILLDVWCVLSGYVNHTPFPLLIRGLAVTSLFPCVIVVGHWMLRRNMYGLRWYFIGTAISATLCLFVFRQSVEVSMLAGGVQDKNTTEMIMGGPLFWIRRLFPFLSIPNKGWYLECPLAYSVFAPLFMAGFALLTTTSGRSASLGAAGAALLVLWGGKRERTMKRVSRNFWVFVLLGAFGVVLFKEGYSFAASHDFLGEEARTKYELQTRGGTSIGKLILGGRGDSLGGLLACVDRPIIGYGPWAEDKWGYNMEFLRRFGEPEDYDDYVRMQSVKERDGRYPLFMGHSYITQFWLWYGMFGLLIWLYVLFVLVRYLKQDCWAVPQWYMWLAAGVPAYCWAVFFSPFGGDRIMNIMFVVACLLARAVRKGRMMLPFDMQMEILKAESR